jgi:hypothetical protein
VLYGWQHPGGGRDLAVVLGEQQPRVRADRYALAILDEAQRLGVSRVFTFAAMATPVDPREPARVFAAATNAALLEEVREHGAEVLQEGEVSGLNGSFLAAASARGLDGACLLGEFPFFASAIANPKASSAVLRVFTGLAGIELDRAELDADGARIERGLVEQLDKLRQATDLASAAARGEPIEEPEFPTAYQVDDEDDEEEDDAEPPPAEPEPEPAIPDDVRARIEALFAGAGRDRDRALALKAELDRHDLFKRYEDRFLDLFRQGS